MNNIKRNILLYLDSYPMVVSLPLEQRGLLLTALMVYGDRLSRDVGTEAEEIADQFPQLTREANAIFGFMAGNILRDTQKWLNRQQYKGKSGKNRPAVPSSAAEQEQNARENMERTRQLMERLNGAQ